MQGTQVEDRLGAALIQPGRRRYRLLRGFLEWMIQESSRVEPRITSEFVPYRMECDAVRDFLSFTQKEKENDYV